MISDRFCTNLLSVEGVKSKDTGDERKGEKKGSPSRKKATGIGNFVETAQTFGSFADTEAHCGNFIALEKLAMNLATLLNACSGQPVNDRPPSFNNHRKLHMVALFLLLTPL